VKTLYIIRHAKSSWEDPDLDDFDRPLNDRGEKDAPRMGKRLHKMNVQTNLICSSPANRALTTAKYIAEAIHYPDHAIVENPRLYHAGDDRILDIIRTFDPGIETAMIVGHNPGLTDFVNALLGEGIRNIPTAGVVGGRLKINLWKEAKWSCGGMFLFEYPKKD